jgi:transposase
MKENSSRRAQKKSSNVELTYIGIDLGDKKSRYCAIDREGTITEQMLATTADAFSKHFEGMAKARIALEVGTHSPWVTALLEGWGHKVYVANPRRMESIHKNRRKNDRVDAKTLARLVRADPELLYPIRHRGVAVREDLVLLRARDALVQTRSKLINTVRGLVKSVGGRIGSCSAASFAKRAKGEVPEAIRDAVMPVVEMIETLTARIGGYDRAVAEMATTKYPETELLKQLAGVGDLTSLAFVLTIENPKRFRKSRDVGPYLGLIPRQDESGETSKQLRITKTGDRMLRRLLVGSAHYIMGPFGPDCDLRRFGEAMAARGGKNAKKRAIVAVARRLGVLLHRLWTTAEVYEPLHNARLKGELVEPAA